MGSHCDTGNLGMSLSSAEASGGLEIGSEGAMVTQKLPELVTSCILSHNLKKKM